MTPRKFPTFSENGFPCAAQEDIHEIRGMVRSSVELQERMNESLENRVSELITVLTDINKTLMKGGGLALMVFAFLWFVDHFGVKDAKQIIEAFAAN